MTTIGKVLRDASVAFQQKNYEECLEIISGQQEDIYEGSEKVEMNIKIGTMVGLCHYNRAVVNKDQSSELFEKALKEFNKVIANYKEYENIQQGNMKAIVENTAGLDIVITSTKVNYLAGLCLFHTNRYKEAIPYFNTCALMASNLQVNIGSVADKDLTKSFLLESQKCYLNRGICYNECKNNEPAEKDLLKFISLVETSEMTPEQQKLQLFIAFTNLANTKLNKNQHEESIKFFSRAIDTFNTMNKDSQEAHFENYIKAKLKRATTLQKYINFNVYSCKNDESLLKLLETYREMASNDIDTAKWNKGLSFYHLVQYVKMILLFCKHLDGLIARDKLVPLYQDAASKLEEGISIQPNNARLYSDLALCKSKVGEESLENVLNLYNKSFELTNGEPTDKVSRQRLAKIYFERSVIYYKLADKENARKDLDNAIHYNPYFSDAYYNRGFLLKDSEDDIEQALDDLGATCEMNLEDTECALLTAVLLVKQGNKGGAQLIIEEFIKFNANNSTLKDLLAAIDKDESLDAFDSIPAFRESHKKTKIWTPKRNSNPSQDRASVRNEVTTANLDEEAKNDDYFCDPNFPAVSKSIYGTGESDLPSDLKWYRAWDIPFLTEKAVLFAQGSNNSDIVQGAIGDCWLLASFSIVADYPDLMKKVILEEKSDPETGKYTFSIFGDGGPKEVVIDNRLPCYSGSGPAFATSSTGYEMWVSLLEKAFAAYYGSYHSLQSGSLREGLVSLTGGFPFTVEVSFENKEEVWETIKSVKKKSTDASSYCLMGCRTDKPVERTGIQSHHAYAILDCFDCPLEKTNGKRTRLIKIRNPWGFGELSKTDYSDDSKWWNDELRKYVGTPENEEDGIFFMSLGAFVKTWTQIQGVRLFDPNQWSEVNFVDQMKQKPGKDLDDWGLDMCSFSPQYIIHNTHEDNDIKIVLGQRDVRFSKDKKNEYKSRAIFLFKYPEEKFKGDESTRLQTIGEENETVVESVYDDCYRETSVEKTVPIGHYVVILNEFYSALRSEEYFLRIISRKPITVVRKPVE